MLLKRLQQMHRQHRERKHHSLARINLISVATNKIPTTSMDIHVEIKGYSRTVSEEAVRDKIKAGELTDSTMAWAEGLTEWIPLRNLLSSIDPNTGELIATPEKPHKLPKKVTRDDSQSTPRPGNSGRELIFDLLRGRYTIGKLWTPMNFLRVEQEVFAAMGTLNKSYLELCKEFAWLIGAEKKPKGKAIAPITDITSNMVMKKLMWEYKRRAGSLKASFIFKNVQVDLQDALRKLPPAEMEEFRKFCIEIALANRK